MNTDAADHATGAAQKILIRDNGLPHPFTRGASPPAGARRG